MSVLRIAFLSSAVLEFFAALGVAGMAVYFGLTYLGFLDLRATSLTLHVGFFCLLMAPEAYAPLRQFAAHYHDRAAARAAVSQIAAAFDGLPNTPTAGGDQGSAGQVAGVDSGEPARGFPVVLRDLRVHAPERTRPVFNAAAMTVAAGEHVALMGPSGSGKTTLLEALSRLRPSDGRIVLDGTPLTDWDEGSLRKRVLLIGQKPFLFAGSIADNIRLGCATVTDKQVYDAARRAAVLEFAVTLPAGLDSMLGPRGRGLSGGQAQRVALARLFLRDPALILLDEPTAHLDETTQTRVLDAILSFAQGRTLIVATHASAVARRLPRLVRLTDGNLETA